MKAEYLPGVYTMYGRGYEHSIPFKDLVQGSLDVVISGTTIIGSDENNRLIPIWCLDENGYHFCTMQVGNTGHPAHTPRTYTYRYGETEFGMHNKLPGNTIYLQPRL